ncbi:MAG: PAS domain-containing protein [Myxococcota bacterium]
MRWNPAAAQLTGCSASRAVGRTLQAALGLSGRVDAVRGAIEQRRRSEAAISAGGRLLEIVCMPVDDRVIGTIVASDVAGQRACAAIEAATTALMIVDARIQITHANPAAVALLGAHQDALRALAPAFDVHNPVGSGIEGLFESDPRQAALLRGRGQRSTRAPPANETAGALAKIVGSVKQVSLLISRIAAASGEQTQGISQVDIGLKQVDQVTQQNTASAEESAAAAEELSSQAVKLREQLGRLTLKEKAPELNLRDLPPELLRAVKAYLAREVAPPENRLRPRSRPRAQGDPTCRCR